MIMVAPHISTICSLSNNTQPIDSTFAIIILLLMVYVFGCMFWPIDVKNSDDIADKLTGEKNV